MTGSDDDDGQFINIRNQASLALAGNIVDAGFSFIGLILFANVLGADGLGKFYVILAVVKVLLFPISGVGQSVMKRGSERGLAPDEFFGGGLVYGTLYVLLVGAVVASLAVTAPSLLTYGPVIVSAAFTVFVTRVAYYLLLDTYRSSGQTGYANLTDNALGILETGIQVTLILAGFGITGLLVGTAAATVLISVALVALAQISVAKPTLDTLTSIWRFARWSVITSGLGTMYGRLPVLVLGIALGNTVAGYYTSAMRLLMLGSYVGGAIAPALLVRVSATRDDQHESSERSSLKPSLQYASVLAIPMMFGAFVIPDALMVTIFGPTFSGTGDVLILLSLYHVLNVYCTVFDSFFDGIGEPKMATRSTATSLMVRIAAIILLLPQFDLLGVVAAVVFSHVAHFAVSEYFLWRTTGDTVLPTRSVFQFVSGGLMGVVVAGLVAAYPVTGWVSLIGTVGTGAILYAGVLLVLDEYFRHAVVDVLSGLTGTAASQ